jgi:hypothetical protein
MKLLGAADVSETLLLFVLCSANVKMSGDVLSDRTFPALWSNDQAVGESARRVGWARGTVERDFLKTAVWAGNVN